MKTRMTIIMLGVLLLFGGTAGAVQNLLDGSRIPKFVEPLPVAGDITVVDATSGAFPAAVSIKVVPTRRGKPVNIAAEEFQSQILPTAVNWPDRPGTCVTTESWVWGYLVPGDDPTVVRPSYLGPVVVAERGVRFNPKYLNNLPVLGNVQSNLPIDMTLDWANPQGIECAPNNRGFWTNPQCGELPSYIGPVPIATHLHGGEVAPAFDGGPDAWFTPNFRKKGSGWPGPVYDYPNDQQESTLWFHDHALGITRLNVYAGLAGVYPIIDPANPPQATMPAFPAYDIPLIIQDRTFDTDCEIFYNLASNAQPNPRVHPFWIPEFIGDTIVVNGKTWPYLEVEARQYRFRFVNGSNARFYDLTLDDGTPFIVIATDDGYLETAVSTPNVIIAPGERYEVIVDFSLTEETEIIMMNAAATPFPGGDPVIADLTDTVMQFRVNLPLVGTDVLPIIAGTPIRPTPLVPIVEGFDLENGITRQLTLNEVIGPGGPLELVVNNSKFNLAGILPGCTTPLCRETELPAVGDTEIWEIINITADAHPMHTHLTSFQVLDRTPFRADRWIFSYDEALVRNDVLPGEGPPNQYNVKNADGAIGGNPAISRFLRLGEREGPLPYEMGWKDTVITYPGEVTRIVIRWATTDTVVSAPGDNTYPFDPTHLKGGVGYVWHCHIIDHEDNEMMRNYVVGKKRQAVFPMP